VNIPWTLVISAVGGYLMGSVPFGVIAARLGGIGDIRKIGSGNIGATNVLRSGRKDLAAFTLIGDIGKGVAAALIARALWGETAGAIGGGAAFLGHLYPVWLRFKGGKGVATFFGVCLTVAGPAGVLSALTWIGMAALFRISSLAALTAAALTPLYALATDQPPASVGLAVFMAVLIFIRHAANIERLINGQEPRIGKKKSDATGGDDAA
jgi:glycerol-3-phosphate acyltransferase PlsY